MFQRFGKPVEKKQTLPEETARALPPLAPSACHTERCPGGGLLQELAEGSGSRAGSKGPARQVSEQPARSTRVEVEHHTARNWGGRHENEDRVMCHRDTVPGSHLTFDLVGVLDGHDTEAASDLVSSRLPHEVSGCLKQGSTVAEAHTLSMAKLEDDLKSVTSSAGSCVLSCLVSGRFLWCANLGDCRACLIGLAVPDAPSGSSTAPTGAAVKPKVTGITWMSTDHKASCPSEKARIIQAGGQVQDGRVEGLEPSRTLGDFDVKAQVPKGVISIVPEVRRYEFVPDGTSPAQAVLVCATDGVWDVLGGSDIVDLIRARKEICRLQTAVANESERPDREVLKLLAEDLVQFSIAKGSRDDCTAIVAFISVPPAA